MCYLEGGKGVSWKRHKGVFRGAGNVPYLDLPGTLLPSFISVRFIHAALCSSSSSFILLLYSIGLYEHATIYLSPGRGMVKPLTRGHRGHVRSFPGGRAGGTGRTPLGPLTFHLPAATRVTS